VSESTLLLRSGLLEGISLLVAGAATEQEAAPVGAMPPAVAPRAKGSFLAAVRADCTELGARVQTCVPDAVEEASTDQAVKAAVAELGSLDLLVVDGAGLYMLGTADGGGAAVGGGAHRALRACLDATWNVTRAVVNHAFLPADRGPSTRRIVYLAPPPGAGESAGAARAGLENLSRTLSTEWARHGITVVTIAPGDTTTAGEVAALCAYLASPAGDYFSGCLLDLRGS
jgi:NAD(P)-dependent dehydrogenase (short-subunit alcohol dehydrogenase family)